MYCKNPADGLRNAIISKSMPLVRSIIGKINTPDRPLAQKEDLESAGISGLIQALDSYDCERKNKFNTYAYYRTRGSIIDYLRKIDKLPRKQRNDYGKVQQIIERKSQDLGRDPSDAEVAEELNMNVKDYHQLLSNVQKRNALSLDVNINDGTNSFYDIYAHPDLESPDHHLEKKELAERLQKKIGELKERDRLVLTLYYYEDMTMSEIALLLELTEARISQIVGKLLIQLKQGMTQEEFAQ
jgi:RNA polymerase sigma factor for flagellar operon FliA